MNIEQILKEIYHINNLEELEKIKKKYIWKKWIISLEFKKLKELPSEDRKKKWEELVKARDVIEKIIIEKYDELFKKNVEKSLQNDIVDITLDKWNTKLWNYGLLLWFRKYLENVLQSMWFNIELWSEIVTKYDNFYSVNIPKDHPAVEMHDTFYLDQTDDWWDNLVLRTHTSASQVKMMKKYWIPCKVMLPWKVFRYENTDPSHDTTFWQLEWIVIDKDISLAHLVWFLEEFFSTIFWQSVKIRLRPAYFPFVEPWFEWDVSCPICWWKWCSLCKHTWWIEIFWAWMIHPNVLKEGNIDSSNYTGFAFWLWITRIVAIKYWIKDIRLFNSWDLRFLNS